MIDTGQQVVDVQMVPVYAYVCLRAPEGDNGTEEFTAFSERLSDLSREGYQLQATHPGYVLLGKVTEIRKLSVDLSRVIFPVTQSSRERN